MSDEFNEAQQRALEMAQQLVRELEGNMDSWAKALLPKAKRTLRELQNPAAVKRTPKSTEVLKYQARRIRMAVHELDATEDIGSTRKGNRK